MEEIEAALSSLKYIGETAVLYKKMGDGFGQIVAFVKILTTITIKEILSDLKKILPPYMVPKQIHILEHLPKNKNGKIDRIQLRGLL